MELTFINRNLIDIRAKIAISFVTPPVNCQRIYSYSTL